MNYSDYMDSVLRDLWAWADRHHRRELDGGKRKGRPPVLKKKFAPRALLVPSKDGRARQIQAAIAKHQRDQWFCSLRSSQALAQSVFGAIQAFDRLDLLEEVPAECGRTAFFEEYRGAEIEFEHKVDWLQEPSPTSVDVWLTGPQRRVAVECKFTEEEFGTCSRPRLRPGNPRYDAQHCNSNYEVQRNRRERCALTEIDILYWRYLPRLFAWAADRDHLPCPFGSVYQLARNALAAGASPHRQAPGHVLVVYDARNPEFRGDGKAERQWRSVVAACRVPGLMRRLSWQRLLTFLMKAPELAYLVEGMRQKYGMRPN